MPPKAVSKKKHALPTFNIQAFPTPALESIDLRMSYRIARGEQGVLTFEPYKSFLLPHWRFATLPVAHQSSSNLNQAFDHYVKAGDLVGADMARKFIQMGMTRAKRYANHKGGRKYDKSVREQERNGGERTELAKSDGHEGRDEKLEVSEHFKGIWRQCTSDEGYLALKEEFQREQKEWDKATKKLKKEVKSEEDGDESNIKGEVKREDDGDG
ncbi:uncharacterized protein LTR77_009241 [Saxophila tyrrhenica]|uniref:DUF4385 multi-domain protein n=1 Tax=Saxophila tyrrhenica TaxID=1690608 RepID=A0AAV9P2F1_9PEZI|nr:hypothetical protein LTR77_009241 [Saxophila tyrrhenica]